MHQCFSCDALSENPWRCNFCGRVTITDQCVGINVDALEVLAAPQSAVTARSDVVDSSSESDPPPPPPRHSHPMALAPGTTQYVAQINEMLQLSLLRGYPIVCARHCSSVALGALDVFGESRSLLFHRHREFADVLGECARPQISWYDLNDAVPPITFQQSVAMTGFWIHQANQIVCGVVGLSLIHI